MFAVVITEKGGSQRKLDFDKTEVTIGRVQGNDIILPKGNVSKRHSRIVLKDNRFIVVDLKSTNGTYVNGRKITSPLVVKAGDKIYIGDFIITLEEPAGASASPGGAGMSAPPPMPASPMSAPMGGAPPGGGFGGSPAPMGGPPPGGGFGGSPAPMGGPPPGGGFGGSPAPMGASPQGGFGGSPAPMGGPPPLGGGARSAPPPPRPGGGGFGPPAPIAPAPPPLPRQESPPSEPPPMPAGADRFALDEEPAEETAVPSPRVVQPARSPSGPLQAQREAPAQREAAMRTDAPPPQREAPAQREAPPQREQREAPPQREAPAPARMESPRETSRAIEAPRVMGGAAASDVVHEFRTIELGPEGLGPLGALMEEVGVLEIVVEGTSVLVDRGNGLTATGQRFTSGDSVTRVARHLLSRARVQLDASRPIAEATLPDGTHILAILPPVAVGGALVEIRRVGRPAPSGESLVSAGMLSADMLSTLRKAIATRRNVVVVGPSDAGVAQLVSVLAAMGGSDERLLVIEAMSELPIANPRAVRLAAAGTSFSELLVRASRLRADRVVIDGVRGGEAREALVLAASRGSGTIVGVRTASGEAVLHHLESLASLVGGRDGVNALVSSAVQVVVRLARGADGSRRIESISEASGGNLTELFEHGEGGFASTGATPTFG